MGFYIRKGLNFGPIRINLSKSGLGLSAGIKGLRIGTGPKGNYLHAGRKGLYYRKYYSGKKKQKSRNQVRNYSSEEIFVDTGVTYPSNSLATSVEIPKLAVFPKLFPFMWLSFGGGLVGLVGLFYKNYTLAIAIMGLTIMLVFGIIYIISKIINIKWRRKIDNYLNRLEQSINEGVDIDPILAKGLSEMTDKYREDYVAHALLLLAVTSIEKPEKISNDKLLRYKKRLCLDDTTFYTVKLIAFKEYFDSALEDNYLDHIEEKRLRQYAENLDIHEQDIADEMRTISVMSRIRGFQQDDLKPVNVDVPLQRNEKCYFTNAGRLIKRKVLRRRTVEGVKLKQVGFVVDKEGSLYVTDKRILLVGNGTYSIRINKILDLILTEAKNLVEMALDNRSKPVYLTTPDSVVFAAVLEKLRITEQNSTI